MLYSAHCGGSVHSRGWRAIYKCFPPPAAAATKHESNKCTWDGFYEKINSFLRPCQTYVKISVWGYGLIFLKFYSRLMKLRFKDRDQSKWCFFLTFYYLPKIILAEHADIVHTHFTRLLIIWLNFFLCKIRAVPESLHFGESMGIFFFQAELWILLFLLWPLMQK